MFLMFPANSPINTQRCTNFVTVDDNVVEVTEDFTVTATGAAFVHEQSSIQVTLQDNDGELDNYVALQLSVVSNVLILWFTAPIFEFEEQEHLSLEATSPTVLSLRLAASSGVLSFPISLNLTVGSGTACESTFYG